MIKSGFIILAVIFFICNFHLTDTFGCTVIVVGKEASIDGSVIISQTDCGENCRIQVVHGNKFEPGEQTPIYWGIQDIERPLNEFGEIIGNIPQVPQTYTYFHSAYPHMNEHQLSFAESTMDQREELYIKREESKQIMTIEQAMALALQRCKTAKNALSLMTTLLDQYGFLPSCDGESESVCIADPNEVWLLEVCSVGPGWDPGTGEPGALWAAQRIPDNHVFLMPNQSLIREIDISDTVNFRASSNYMQFAVDKGWYDPKDGKSFIWQEVYSPPPHEWATSRLWLFYSTVTPNLRKWPERTVTDENFMRGYDAYHEMIEPISIYPFSASPEYKLSIQDVIKFQRSYFAGTIYDKTLDIDWLVPDGEGGFKKSPLTTPFPTRDIRELIDITSRRNVAHAHCYYGMVTELRDWLPDPIGGVYWVFLDNPYVSPYVPIYAGTQKIADCYQTYHPDKFDPASARWAIDFVDNLMYLRWQEADKDLQMVQQSFETALFEKQNEIESEALRLLEDNPQKAREYLTDYTNEKMNEILKLYTDLRYTLIQKYSNNALGY
jgi:dipeptidase